MIKRRKTRVVKIGNIKIGGENPIRIQSMAKTDTRDAKRTIAEIKRLEKAGCEIVRVAVKDKEAARAIKTIKNGINIPLVADIHFDYTLALESIKSGADKIRINPGNISNPSQLKEIIRAAKKRKLPIRIGLNSGSLWSDRQPPYGPWKSVCIRTSKVRKVCKVAIKYARLFEKEGFRDILISIKSSNVEETVKAYRELAGLCDYPFHLGVTAAGPYDAGIVKSSIGIGTLLLDGIGDTIRVSLTGDPVDEVIAAKRILQALGLRNFGPDIISCPTCGRCQVDLAGVVAEFEKAIGKAVVLPPRSLGKPLLSTAGVEQPPLTVAIMGCEVNGPGEAREADMGIAFGRDSGLLFRKGKVVKKVKAKDAVKELVRIIEVRLP